MLRNYVIIALRHLRRRPLPTVINLAGLAVGMACALLILCWVAHERSYDRFHVDAARLFKVVDRYTFSGQTTDSAVISAPMAPAMEASFPEVEAAVRIQFTTGIIRRGPETFFELDNVLFADSAFFRFFTFPLVRGDAATALEAPRTVVLSTTLAASLFGDTDPLGKHVMLTAYGEREYTVTGIAADAPSNSHIQFDAIASHSTLQTVFTTLDNWLVYGTHAYVRLRPGASPDAVTTRLAPLVLEHVGPDLAAKYGHHLVPITSLHLGPSRRGEMQPVGNRIYLYAFLAAVFFILLIAGVNFVNLTTALCAERTREVGTRKALGAHRAQLVSQYVGEAVLLCGIAAMVAVVLARGLLPFFNLLAGRSLTLPFGDPVWWMMIAGGAVVLGLLAGLYPALVLTKTPLVPALKGDAVPTSHRARLRQALVVCQFAVTIVLLIGVGVIGQQLRYVQQKRLGFEPSQVMVLPIRNAQVAAQRETMRAALARLPGVVQAGTGSSVPGKNVGMGPFRLEGGDVDANHIFSNLVVDADYVTTLGLTMAAGRAFDREMGSDSSAFLLNEAAARAFGFGDPSQAIGSIIEMGSASATTSVAKRGPVLGVVRDYHFKSLHDAIGPLVLQLQQSGYSFFAVRVEAAGLAATLERLRTEWDRFGTGDPFSYTFLDATFSAQYAAERQTASIFRAFAVLAAMLSCLGLFGLAALTAERRRKELGVRKVLGATVPHLVSLIVREFAMLVAVAFVVAVPVAHFGATRWLAGFAYHASPWWGLFVLGGGAAFAVAVLAVSYHAYRAATIDPVRALRHK